MAPSVGIDLGSTYSSIAYMHESGEIEVILNPHGESAIPSVVMVDDDGRALVGELASSMEPLDGQLSRLADSEMLSARKRPGLDNETLLDEVSGSILRYLFDFASDATGIVDRRVAIVVPEGLSEDRLSAMRFGCTMAGLNAETIQGWAATALSLRAVGCGDGWLFFLDLGGTSTTCSIVDMQEMRLVYTDLDSHGGVSWDAALFHLVLRKVANQSGLTDDAFMEENVELQLRRDVEHKKKVLSKRDKATFRVEDGAAITKMDVTREEFETASLHLVDHVVEMVGRARAGFTESHPDAQLGELWLVGGASQMPMIPEAIRQRIGIEVRTSDPQYDVVRGAAIAGSYIADYSRNLDYAVEAGPDLTEFFSSISYDQLNNVIWLTLGFGVSKLLARVKGRAARLEITQEVAIQSAIATVEEYDPSLAGKGLSPVRATHSPPGDWEIELHHRKRVVTVSLTIEHSRVKATVTSDSRFFD